MVRRDKRNIGKRVRLIKRTHENIPVGSTGRISGFRGNKSTRPKIPYVYVTWDRMPGHSIPSNFDVGGDVIEYVK